MPNRRKILAKRRKGKEIARKRGYKERSQVEFVKRSIADMRTNLAQKEAYHLLNTIRRKVEEKTLSLVRAIETMPEGETKKQMVKTAKRMYNNLKKVETFCYDAPLDKRIGENQEDAYELLFRLYGPKWRDALEKPNQ